MIVSTIDLGVAVDQLRWLLQFPFHSHAADG